MMYKMALMSYGSRRVFPIIASATFLLSQNSIDCSGVHLVMEQVQTWDRNGRKVAKLYHTTVALYNQEVSVRPFSADRIADQQSEKIDGLIRSECERLHGEPWMVASRF